MSVLQVISNRPGAGKTCLAGALLHRRAAAGQPVAYYKPRAPESDPDVAFMAGRYAVPSVDPTADVAETVVKAGVQFDLTLVEWPLPAAVESSPTPLAGYPILLLWDYTGGLDVAAEAARIAATARRLGDDLTGIIINNVRRHRRREVGRGIVAVLREQGMPVSGAIPEDREMLALTVGQIADYLGGRWLQEPENAETWVDRFLIGGNIMDSGPNYFGRYSHQAVITRAGRPDIQLASLSCDTKCLVLTGGEEPAEYVRVEARKRATPVVLVESNTLDTAESLAGLLQRANPYSEHKLARFAALMEQHLNFNYESGITNQESGTENGGRRNTQERFP